MRPGAGPAALHNHYHHHGDEKSPSVQYTRAPTAEQPPATLSTGTKPAAAVAGHKEEWELTGLIPDEVDEKEQRQPPWLKVRVDCAFLINEHTHKCGTNCVRASKHVQCNLKQMRQPDKSCAEWASAERASIRCRLRITSMARTLTRA
jgi:hypothetical protein